MQNSEINRSEDPNPLKTFFSVLVTLYFLLSGVLVGIGMIFLFIYLLGK